VKLTRTPKLNTVRMWQGQRAALSLSAQSGREELRKDLRASASVPHLVRRGDGAARRPYRLRNSRLPLDSGQGIQFFVCVNAVSSGVNDCWRDKYQQGLFMTVRE
jgi:hypothetical protein